MWDDFRERRDLGGRWALTFGTPLFRGSKVLRKHPTRPRSRAMAESALKSGDRSLAVDVFATGDRTGPDWDHLRRRCHELTGVDLSDLPHLRAVPESG